MSSKFKKEAMKLLKAIEFEKASLSQNKGKIILTHFDRGTKKDRLHDGRYYPKITRPQMKYSEIFREGLEPNQEYDEWKNWRDGIRNFGYKNNRIYKKIKEGMFWDKEVYNKLKRLNAKLRKHEHIRRLMRRKEKIKEKRQPNRYFA